MSFRDFELHECLKHLFLVCIEVVLGRVQQPITNFIGPWDNFVVHGVNNSTPDTQIILKEPTSNELTIRNGDHGVTRTPLPQ